jgi:prepilin-type N-terminal cleavage/methylation domain-containing protein
MKTTLTELRHSGRTNGFTLAEVMVSAAITGFLFVAVYAGFATGFAAVQLSRENLRATQIMLERLERIRLYTFAQLTNAAYNPPAFTEYYDPVNQAKGHGGAAYNGTVTTSFPPFGSVPEGYRPSMRLVTVAVTWTSGKVPRSRSMQTYVAQVGMRDYIAAGQ